MDLSDTPNDRVLNMLQSFEPLLINYLKTDPKDKELAEKALGNLRKALAGAYDKLPMPEEKKPVKKSATYCPELTELQIALGQAGRAVETPVGLTGLETYLRWGRR